MMKLLLLLSLVWYARRCYGYTLKELSQRNDYSQSLIMGGYGTTIEKYPAMAYLLMSFKSDDADCEGTVLSPNYILTAGHCLKDSPIYVEITVGTTNIKSKNGRHYISTEYHIHPNFKGEQTDCDIGLIKPNTTMILDGVVKAVQLAAPASKVTSGELITVVGWGTISEKTDISIELRAVDIPVVDLPQCQQIYKNKKEAITPKMFCAGYMEGGKGSCYGDSGGPAITSAGVQVGIVSGSEGCGKRGYPEFFTDVASLRDWIYSVARV